MATLNIDFDIGDLDQELQQVINKFNDLETEITGMAKGISEVLGSMLVPSLGECILYSGTLAEILNDIYENGIKASAGMLSIVHTGPAATQALKGLSGQAAEASAATETVGSSLGKVSDISWGVSGVAALAATLIAIPEPATSAAGALMLLISGVFGAFGGVTGVIDAFSEKTVSTVENMNELAEASFNVEEYITEMAASVNSIDFSGISVSEPQLEFNIDSTGEAFNEYRERVSSGLMELLVVAVNTEEGITEEVLNEYQSRTEGITAEMEKRRANEISQYLMRVSEIGTISEEEKNSALQLINDKYDNEILASNDYYTALQDVMTNHYSAEAGITAEGWSILQSTYQQGQQPLLEVSKGSYNQLEEFALSHLDEVNSLTSEKMEENVNTAKEYYAQTEADAANLFEAKKANQAELLQLNGDSYTEQYEQQVLAAEKEYNETMKWADLSKKAVINSSLEELTSRNAINDEGYQGMITSRQKMEDETLAHSTRIQEISDEYNTKLSDAAALGYGNSSEYSKLWAEMYDEREEEEARHLDVMNGYKNLELESVNSLDEGTQQAYLNMLAVAQTEGVNISDEVLNMVETIDDAVGGIPEELLSSAQEDESAAEGGNTTISNYLDGATEALDINDDGESNAILGITDGMLNSFNVGLADEEKLEEISLASKNIVELGILNPITTALGIDEDGVSQVIKRQGVGVMDGLIQGIESKFKDLAAAWSKVTDLLVYEIPEVTEQKSPSKLLRRQGEYAIQGLEIGIENRIKPLSDKMMKVSSLFTSLFDSNSVTDSSGMYNRKDYNQNFSATVNVQGDNVLDWERKVRGMLRQQAALVAR